MNKTLLLRVQASEAILVSGIKESPKQCVIIPFHTRILASQLILIISIAICGPDTVLSSSAGSRHEQILGTSLINRVGSI
jgi:hypothetical protein